MQRALAAVVTLERADRTLLQIPQAQLPRLRADLEAEFQFHDQFKTIANGTNYGSVIVASCKRPPSVHRDSACRAIINRSKANRIPRANGRLTR
jgi:hypothetical protein